MAAQDQDQGPEQRFRGNRGQLWTLLMTEFWERFAFYGIRWAITLYIVQEFFANDPSGQATASATYGAYLALVYATTIFGGWVADRLIGHQRANSARSGARRHWRLRDHRPHHDVFLVGLAIVLVGTGPFRPSVSAMVGRIYAPEDPRRDRGFTIFYMAIYAGALTGPLATGLLASAITGAPMMQNYKIMFIASGVGMIISLLWFWFGRRQLGDIGRPPKGKNGAGRLVATLIGSAIAVPTLYFAARARRHRSFAMGSGRTSSSPWRSCCSLRLCARTACNATSRSHQLHLAFDASDGPADEIGDIALLLIGHGARIDEPNWLSRTPVEMALRQGLADLALAMAKGGSPEPGGHWSDWLVAAVEANNHDALDQLIDLNAAALNGHDRRGRTALHVAAATADVWVIDALNERGADLEAPNSAGETALRVATRERREEAALLLRAAGAKPPKFVSLRNGEFVVSNDQEIAADLLPSLTRHVAADWPFAMIIPGEWLTCSPEEGAQRLLPLFADPLFAVSSAAERILAVRRLPLACLADTELCQAWIGSADVADGYLTYVSTSKSR